MISVQCSCGAALKVQDALAGKRGKCPKCGSVVEIPVDSPLIEPPTLDVTEASPFAAGAQVMAAPASGFQCPFCKSTAAPMVNSKISTGGLVLFAVLLIFCFPICWLPLLMDKETYRQCRACGIKLG